MVVAGPEEVEALDSASEAHHHTSEVQVVVLLSINIISKVLLYRHRTLEMAKVWLLLVLLTNLVDGAMVAERKIPVLSSTEVFLERNLNQCLHQVSPKALNQLLEQLQHQLLVHLVQFVTTFRVEYAKESNASTLINCRE